MNAPGVCVRPMQEDDLRRVSEIERRVFPTPWSVASFRVELGGDPISLSLVAVVDEAVQGYLVSWVVVDELHVGNVAVAPERQGSGLATRLLVTAYREAAARGAKYATLEVRVGNRRAISIYERFGLRPVAIRKRYYSDNGEDALVMMGDISEGLEVTI